MRRFLPVLALLLATAAAVPARAEVTPETRSAARAMVEASGGVTQARQAATLMRQQIIAMIAQRSGKPVPEVTSIVDDVLMPEVLAQIPSLVDAIAEVWAGQLSVTELQELAKFYQTPLGRRLVETSPVVAAQTMTLAGAWGQKVAVEALTKNGEKLRARGLTL